MSLGSDHRPHVVIVGGGFAGLYAGKALARAPVRITLVDRQNHHLFQPLLYQVATAGLSSVDVAEPIRKIFRRQRNMRVILAEAEGVDLERRRLLLGRTGDLAYDFLIVATGARHAYFGNDHWEPLAPGLKTLRDALEIRHRVLTAFERAETAATEADRRGWLTFVVVGAGPTGAEMAGALAEIARHTLVRDFRSFDPSQARVLLLEGLDRVLPPYPRDLSARARRQLEALGVEVRTGARVTGLAPGRVEIGDQTVAAHTVVWAAGVSASPLGARLGAELDRAGRVRVDPTLALPGRPEVFVVGDLAAIEQDGEPVPGVAPAAIQQGRHAAANIGRALAGRPALAFRYRDRGSMATLGRKAAVARLGRLHLSGWIAWVAWLTIHIFFLIGFRNRFVVLFEWARSYLTYQRSARLIVETGDDDAPAVD